ncbi:hypothetical protein AMECASPLE_035520 [Ameca splendens]|uniref:Uncharacterized protein n=1 Tax=Ameca splendens TaxID=208324 RepID=A0ABV0Z5D7_9TELE
MSPDPRPGSRVGPRLRRTGRHHVPRFGSRHEGFLNADARCPLMLLSATVRDLCYCHGGCISLSLLCEQRLFSSAVLLVAHWDCYAATLRMIQLLMCSISS